MLPQVVTEALWVVDRGEGGLQSRIRWLGAFLQTDRCSIFFLFLAWSHDRSTGVS